VLGFRGESGKLSDSTSPLHLLAAKGGIAPMGVAVDFGAMMSMFACVLASTTAAGRVAMTVARGGLLPAIFERTNRRHGTPGLAIALSVGLMLGATVAMALRAMTGFDMLDLLGSIAVFGYITAYVLVAVALPFARRAVGQNSLRVIVISVVTIAVMLLIVIYDLISTSDPAHAPIPYIYLVYLTAGIVWLKVKRPRRTPPPGAAVGQ
jgi:amino acid transporter